MADESNSADVSMADDISMEVNSEEDNESENSALALTEEVTSADYYMDFYANYVNFEDMLKDEESILIFRDVMYENEHLFKGKIVLNLFSGTGLFSLFAAEAGAARVIAIEGSKIVDFAEQIVIDNNLQHVVTVVKGIVEEVELPDGIEKVDIIVSAWMGYCLIYESMLDAVIFARDKWLKPNGMIFPDRASLYIAAVENCESNEEKYDWWNNVYGYNMNSIRNVCIKEPLAVFVEPEQIVSSASLIKEIDLYTLKKEDLTVSSPFSLKMNRDDFVDSLLTFYKVEFSKSKEFFEFSTAPENTECQWRQTLFYLDKCFPVKTNEEMHGKFIMYPDGDYETAFDFEIKIKFKGEFAEVNESCKYRMGH